MAEIWNYSKFKLTDAMRIRGVKDLEDENLERMLDFIEQSNDIDRIDETSMKFLEMMQEAGHKQVVIGRPVHLIPYLVPLLQRNGVEVYIPYNQVTSEQFMHPDEDVTAVQTMIFRNHLVHVKHYPQIMPAEVKKIWMEKEFEISVEAVPDMSEFKANPLLEIAELRSRVSTWTFDSWEEMIEWFSEVKSGIGLEKIFGYEIINLDDMWEMFDGLLVEIGVERETLEPKYGNLSDEPIWNYSLMPLNEILLEQGIRDIDEQDRKFLEDKLKFFDAHESNGEERLEELPFDYEIENFALMILDRIRMNGHKKVMLSRPEHLVPYLTPILQNAKIEVYLPNERLNFEHYANWMVSRSLLENVYFKLKSQPLIRAIEIFNPNQDFDIGFQLNVETGDFLVNYENKKNLSHVDEYRPKSSIPNFIHEWILCNILYLKTYEFTKYSFLLYNTVVASKTAFYETFREFLGDIAKRKLADDDINSITNEFDNISEMLQILDNDDLKTYARYIHVGHQELFSSNYHAATNQLEKAHTLYSKFSDQYKNVVNSLNPQVINKNNIKRSTMLSVYYANLCNLLGMSYGVVGNKIEAIAYCEQSVNEYKKYEDVVELYFKRNNALLNYINAYNKMNSFDETIDLVMNYIDQYQSDTDLRIKLTYQLAIVYREKLDFANAFECVREVEKLVENEKSYISWSLKAQNIEASIYYLDNDLTKALTKLENILENEHWKPNPELIVVLFGYLFLYFEINGKFDQKYYLQMQKIYEDDFKFYKNLYKAIGMHQIFKEDKHIEGIEVFNELILDTDKNVLLYSLIFICKFLFDEIQYYKQLNFEIREIMAYLKDKVSYHIFHQLVIIIYYFEIENSLEGRYYFNLIQNMGKTLHEGDNVLDVEDFIALSKVKKKEIIINMLGFKLYNIIIE